MTEYKVAVVGSGGVGKSALTIRLLQNYFITDYDPTIEDYYRKQVTVDEEICLLDVLDTAGQEEFKSLRHYYMRIREGFVLVYSITDRNSFEEISSFRDQILQNRDASSAPIVIVGNKCDMADERKVDASEGQALADQWGVSFFEASAKERINVDDVFFDCVRQMKRFREGNPNPEPKKSVRKKKKGLCTIL